MKRARSSPPSKKPATELCMLCVVWGGADDVWLRWGEPDLVEIDAIAAHAPSIRRMLDAVLGQGVTSHPTGSMWSLRFDTTGDFPKDEDSRTITNHPIDDEVLHDEITSLMGTGGCEGRVVGRIVFQTEM